MPCRVGQGVDAVRVLVAEDLLVAREAPRVVVEHGGALASGDQRMDR